MSRAGCTSAMALRHARNKGTVSGTFSVGEGFKNTSKECTLETMGFPAQVLETQHPLSPKVAEPEEFICTHSIKSFCSVQGHRGTSCSEGDD